ncbi:MauE/DoxX family redox-associated membrane protein [Actinomadura sp. HBU206391]|uniref:MauE/DoxX family redox-associated membrane protein n=1 Tax=Actinomadura sp. HBU206391 TaxID=2731692 RepID=UPI00164EFE31|nr:MauE/DoxX family redox-associated membrane protein [Actinomadura sp. HBU206391]MBC6461736.1 methylamine utilization protein MauE [Actinomadura sp. HBU206391]
MEYVALAGRCVIGSVFLIAAVGKLRDRSSRDGFHSAVSAVVPGVRFARLGLVVLAVEFTVAILVVPAATAGWGLGMAAGTLLAFSVALWSVLRRGVPVSCHCFGRSAMPVSRAHVLRNTVLLAIAVAGSIAHADAADVALHPGGAVIAVTGALVVIIGVLFTDDLASLFAPTSRSSRI